MKARVFIDAFAEVVVGVGMTRRTPAMRYIFREMAKHNVTSRHGPQHAEATGRMFDKLWADMQNPEAKR